MALGSLDHMKARSSYWHRPEMLLDPDLVVERSHPRFDDRANAASGSATEILDHGRVPRNPSETPPCRRAHCGQFRARHGVRARPCTWRSAGEESLDVGRPLYARSHGRPHEL